MMELKNISCLTDEDGNIILKDREDGDNSKIIVVVWTDKHKVKEDFSMDQLAEYVMKKDVQLMISERKKDKDGNSYLVGPTGSAYHTLLAQGKIVQPEQPKPYIKKEKR